MKRIARSELERIWNATDQRVGCVSVSQPLPHSVLPFLLYEANAWLGGPAGRIFMVKSFADHQPSFDALLAGVTGSTCTSETLPYGIQFDVLDYQNIDQLEEDAATRAEVQNLLGLFVLCLVGDVSCVLRSTEGSHDIEVYDRGLNFWYSSEKEKRLIVEILTRYQIDFGIRDETD